MAIAPEYYEELGPPGRLARDVPPIDDGLEALALVDTHEALLQRVFDVQEAQILFDHDVSKIDKTRLLGSKLRHHTAFKTYAREYGIDPGADSKDTRNPLRVPADRLIEVGASYAASEQQVMNYLGNPQFFDYLDEVAINRLREVRDQGNIADQAAQVEKLFTEDFSVKQQRYLELRSQTEVMKWISESNPAAAEALVIGTNPNLRHDLPLLETLTQNYVHVQKEIKREQERKAEQERIAAEEEIARSKREAEQAENLANLLSENGKAFPAYLLGRDKNPIDVSELVDTKPVSEVFSILEEEYKNPKYQKHLDKLLSETPKDLPQDTAIAETVLSHLPTDPKMAGRLSYIREVDETRGAVGVVFKYKRPKASALEIQEAFQEKTAFAVGKLATIRDDRIAAGSSASEYLEDLKTGIHNASPKQLAAVALTSLAMVTLSSGSLNTPESPSGKSEVKALIQAQAAPAAVVPEAVVNVDPAVTGGATTAPNPELQTAIKAYEALPDDTRLTKETKNAAVAWAIETTRAITAGKSAALNAGEPSLENKPEAVRSVKLVDEVVLLSLDHITRGDLDKGDIRELTEELSRITALARHPHTLHKLLIDKNLNKINPSSEFEEDLASLISEKLLRDSKEYSDVEKRLIGRMLAQSVAASISPDKRAKVLKDFRVKVTMLNPPPKPKETSHENKNRLKELNPKFTLAQLIAATSIMESGSPADPEAVNQFGCYGYLQYCYWSGRAQKYLGNANAPRTTANQTIVAVKEMTEVINQLGSLDAAMAAWLKGEPAKAIAGKNKSAYLNAIKKADGNGTTIGEYMSVIESHAKKVDVHKQLPFLKTVMKQHPNAVDWSLLDREYPLYSYHRLRQVKPHANQVIEDRKKSPPQTKKQEAAQPPQAAPVSVVPAPIEGAVAPVSLDPNAVAKAIIDAAKDGRHRAAEAEKKWEVTEKGGERIEGAVDLGMHKGAYVGGQEIKTRLYAIEGFKCSNEECSPGDPMYIEGADGNVIVGAKAAKATVAMFRAAKNDGILLTSNSSYRTHEHQKELFAAKPDPNWVATPGNSDHQDPQESAIDFNMGPGVFKWLSNNAHKYGFENYDRENWHWAFKNPDNKW